MPQSAIPAFVAAILRNDIGVHYIFPRIQENDCIFYTDTDTSYQLPVLLDIQWLWHLVWSNFDPRQLSMYQIVYTQSKSSNVIIDAPHFISVLEIIQQIPTDASKQSWFGFLVDMVGGCVNRDTLLPSLVQSQSNPARLLGIWVYKHNEHIPPHPSIWEYKGDADQGVIAALNYGIVVSRQGGSLRLLVEAMFEMCLQRAETASEDAMTLLVRDRYSLYQEMMSDWLART